jgi:hypothetical protein
MINKLSKFSGYLSGRGTVTSATVLLALYFVVGIYSGKFGK